MKNLTMLPKLMLVFGVNLVIFIGLLAMSHQSFTTMVAARSSVLAASEIFDRINQLHIRMLQLRADKREYRMAGGGGQPPQRLGVEAANLRSDFLALSELTRNDPHQQRSIDLLIEQYDMWVDADLTPLLRTPVNAGSEAELRELALAEPGQHAFEAGLATLTRIRDQERQIVDRHSEEMLRLQSRTGFMIGLGGVVAIFVGGLLSMVVAVGITRPLTRISTYARRIALGDYSFPLDIDQRDEVGRLAAELRTFQRGMVEKTRVTELIAQGDLSPSVIPASDKDILGNSINRMVTSLRQARDQSERMDWIKSGLNELALLSSGQTEPHRLADEVLSFLAPYTGAQVATLYLADDDGGLTLFGSYAADADLIERERIPPGQTIVGQAALERRPIAVDRIPEDYLRISSSIGGSAPKSLLALPFSYRDNLIGVVELGAFEPFHEAASQFLQSAAESLAVAFDSLNKQARVRELLGRTQEQARELQQQQEELKTANEELEEHTATLEQSEEELKQQREELQALNEELEEKNDHLELQKVQIQEKNSDLEKAWEDIQRKAAELELASRYKSEFLANMSHELRTPLNSLLLLARSLRDNRSGSLSPDDVEAAGIIHKNGTDLLYLINDILDLSKIEAGKVSISQEQVQLEEVAGSLMMDFGHMAEEKGLSLEVELEKGLPAAIRTDRRRLEQVLRNLVANAVKFTDAGVIKLHISRPKEGELLSRSGLDRNRTVAFNVSDTGIGIPDDKQREIFDAFKQGDGTTSRRYGGTGLGLTIARQLTMILGGDIGVQSEPGKGSTFTLLLPEQGRQGAPPQPRTVRTVAQKPETLPYETAEPEPASEPQAEREPPPQKPPQLPVSTIPDDRGQVGAEDRSILIIEDDTSFAKILLDLCRDKGFKAVVAATGEEGLVMAERLLPTGVILDIRLPGISGWTVLSSLKRNHRTRHIPVHIVSVQEAPHDALIMGAIGFLAKPVAGEDLERAFERIESMVEKKVKDLLLVEDNSDLRKGILRLLEDLEVNVTEADTGRQAIEAVRSRRFDCMILDLGLEDMSGFDLLSSSSRRWMSRSPRSSSTRAGSCQKRRIASCASMPNRSSSRARGAKSGSSTRSRSSCTAWSAPCPRPSSA
jgi:signal transduction histidine kinase/CheY-like chemotaxis protein/HAMP domain-containing protein